MAKLVAIAKTEGKNMLKIDIPEGSGIWAFCSPEVKAYAKKTFKEGDEVELQYEQKNGGYYITFIKRPGSSSTSETKKTAPQSKFVCEDCGKALKDGTYKKCYTCNQKKPSSSEEKDKSSSIEKQNCNNATSRTLVALQGQVDINNILEIADKIWNFYYKKLQ